MGCEVREIILDPQLRKRHIEYLSRVDGLDKPTLMNIVNMYQSILPTRKSDYEVVGLGNGKGLDDYFRIQQFLSNLLNHLRTEELAEMEDYCYTALGLTNVKDEDKQALREDHQLIKEVLHGLNIQTYDPYKAPFNPQQYKKDSPELVCDINETAILGSRFFTYTAVASSNGASKECKMAQTYNKMGMILIKEGFDPGRMITGARGLLILEYKDLESQKNQFADLFSRISEFVPGVGRCSEHAHTLLGFYKGQSDSRPVCLKGLIEKEFKGVTFDYSKHMDK